MQKVYTIWKFKYLNEINDRRKLKLANNHYKTNLIKKCLHSFIIYTKYRRKKELQKGIILFFTIRINKVILLIIR